jgi:response regulator RpfG family c-di-GMP phosphodiesterase
MHLNVRVPAPREQVVLIVDDEPDILHSLSSLLEESIPNVRCVTAESGTAALQLMGKSSVDLVVTDFRMPGMDGLEFLQRAKLLAPRVPRFLLTAYPDLSVAVRAINEAGIEQFLTKPLAPDQVVRAVEGVLLSRRAQQDRDQALARALHVRKEA